MRCARRSTRHGLSGRSSRKRGRHARTAPAARVLPSPPVPPAPESSSRGSTSATAPRGRRSAEERNAEVRAGLTPLAPGERPWSLRIAVLLALLIGVGDLVELLVGGRVKFGSTHTSVGSVLVFSAVMLVCAGGMWRLRYWALLGFQALLGFVILFFSLALIRASNVAGFLIPIAVIGGGGTLFYKLVRVLSRLQLPRP